MREQEIIDPTLFIDNRLLFKNPQDGRIKKIKVGFNWPSFFFDWIALLVKGLIPHALTMLMIHIVSGIILVLVESEGAFVFLSIAYWIIVGIILGMKANEWHARKLISRGWILQNADAAKDALASKEWELTPKKPD